MQEGDRRLGGWLVPLGLVALVAGLVLIALLRGPVELDPDSPEGAVQEYLLAISEERWDDALEVVHPDWLGSCDARDLEIHAPESFMARLGTDPELSGMAVEERFVAIPAEVPTEEPLPVGQTFVEVTITRREPGDVGPGWDEFVSFELIEEDDFWWLVNDPWPYFVWSCRERVP